MLDRHGNHKFSQRNTAECRVSDKLQTFVEDNRGKIPFVFKGSSTDTSHSGRNFISIVGSAERVCDQIRAGFTEQYAVNVVVPFVVPMHTENGQVLRIPADAGLNPFHSGGDIQLGQRAAFRKRKGTDPLQTVGHLDLSYIVKVPQSVCTDIGDSLFDYDGIHRFL